MSATETSSLSDYAPVRRSALGPALNEQGYYVGRADAGPGPRRRSPADAEELRPGRDRLPAAAILGRPLDTDLMLENIVSTVKTAKALDLPIVHSTINVATGRSESTVPELQRDWAREETVADVIEIVLTERLLQE